MIDTHAADYCPTCGQPHETEEPVERLGILLRGNTLVDQGRRERITSGMAKFVRVLLERGSASHELLILRVCPDALSNVRQVYANRLRKHLRNLTGDIVKLYTHHSWGYELISAADERLAA